MATRPIPWSLRLVSYGVYGFLYLPLLMIGIYSFNQARFGLAWTGFTLQWYQQLFQNEAVLAAARNTLILAVVSTLISTLLGTMLGLGLHRYRFPAKGLISSAILIPVVIPDIVMAITLLVFYKLVRESLGGFELGLGTMILSHITFQITFVAIVIRSRLLTLDLDLEEAARDLYADNWQILWCVLLPLLRPALIAAALLAFTLSIDDFVISFFTSGPQSTTLPILIYSAARRGISPEINALSTLIILGTMTAAISTARWGVGNGSR